MTLAERKKLDVIPARIDTHQILHIVHSAKAVHGRYFTLLKSISHSDDKEISDWLSISEKTFRTYKESNRISKPSLIEHAVMLISLFKHGIGIFGSEERFKEWLNRENFAFGKKKPIVYMDTASGIRFIDDRLTGIEYGDNA